MKDPLSNLDYNSDTPTVEIPASAGGTTVEIVDNSFNDDVAQAMKADKTELLRVLNQAMIPDFDHSNPPLIGRQDSDPKGG